MSPAPTKTLPPGAVNADSRAPRSGAAPANWAAAIETTVAPPRSYQAVPMSTAGLLAGIVASALSSACAVTVVAWSTLLDWEAVPLPARRLNAAIDDPSTPLSPMFVEPETMLLTATTLSPPLTPWLFPRNVLFRITIGSSRLAARDAP